MLTGFAAGAGAATAAKAASRGGAGVTAIYERYVERGEGGRAFSGIVRYLRERE